jgi:hypothetical protein
MKCNYPKVQFTTYSFAGFEVQRNSQWGFYGCFATVAHEKFPISCPGALVTLFMLYFGLMNEMIDSKVPERDRFCVSRVLPFMGLAQ